MFSHRSLVYLDACISSNILFRILVSTSDVLLVPQKRISYDYHLFRVEFTYCVLYSTKQ